jgi:hypothetical protein
LGNSTTFKKAERPVDLELASRNPVEFIAVIKAVSAVNTVDPQGV